MKKQAKKSNRGLQHTLTTYPYRSIWLFTIPVILFLTLLIIGFVSEGSQQYSLLASAFLHGHLNFLQSIGGAGQDPVFYKGKIYWSEGPFPSILLMPFVGFFQLFHQFFYQGYLKWLLVIGVWFLVYRLAQKFSYTKEDSTILAFGFCLGSVFIGIASVSASWYFAQVVTTFLLFWSLYEYFNQRRWWLIGTLCGLLLLTRATALPILLFFGLELWATKKHTFRQLLGLVLPVAIAGACTGLYNYVRFKNPFDGGYGAQLLFRSSLESESYGIFSLVHILTNFVSAVFRMPIPIVRDNTSWTLKFPYIANNIYGMSIFFTSPYFLYFFTRPWKTFDRQMRHLLIAILVGALLVFSYFGVGIVQYGYRYSLDFLPELFVLFMLVYRRGHDRITTGMKTLLLGSGIVNFWLLWNMLY